MLIRRREKKEPTTTPDEVEDSPAKAGAALPKAPVEASPGAATVTRRQVGDLLLAENLVTKDQLEEALAFQRENGGFLGKILVEMNYLSQEALASCLVRQCKIPHLNLLDYDIGPNVAQLIPEDVCKKHNLLPIDKLGKILTVAMVNPLDLDALESVRRTCPTLRIKPILCNWEHFELVSKKLFGRSSRGEADAELTALSLGLLSPLRAKSVPAGPEDGSPPRPASMGATDLSKPDLAEGSYTAVRETGTRPTQRETEPTPAAAESGAHDMAEMVRTGVNEALRETLEASREAQALQGAQLAEIAEAILKSVQDASLRVDAANTAAARGESGPRGRQGKSWAVAPVKAAARSEKRAALVNPEAQAEADGRIRESFTSGTPSSTLRFENFFPGKANAFTFKLGQAVAANPGREYNPFFIFGHVGVGKTHLITAMGSEIAAQHPGLRVGYVSASHFSQYLSEAIKNDSREAFREGYCHWDVLILDDIQFLAGRVEAQEEFFHVFNVLHQEGRQIIIASDTPPDRLGLMEKRLVSRFSSGIVGELKAPEWETRMEILRRYTRECNSDIHDDVLSLVAMREPEDVRTMVGALHKIVAFARLVDQQISTELAEEILSHLARDEET